MAYLVEGCGHNDIARLEEGKVGLPAGQKPPLHHPSFMGELGLGQIENHGDFLETLPL